MRLANKVAIITGAGSGIGKATALLFAREGACVVAGVHNSKDIPEIETLSADLPASVAWIECDVTNEEHVERAVAVAVERFGGVDVLFNNAGIEASGTAEQTSNEQWARIMDVNLKGVFLSCKYAAPEICKRGRGSIINNASINGVHGHPALVAYSASKGGVVAMTRAMALDYAPYNVRVNAICPALIVETRLFEKNYAKAPDPDEFLRALIAKHPIGRAGVPDEVAYTVLFLASDESSFITGEEIRIDGGWHIR